MKIFLKTILSICITSAILLTSMISTVQANPGSGVDPTVTSIEPITTHNTQ